MNALPQVALETALPMEIAGWGVLLLSLLITLAWLGSVYR